LTIKNLNRRRTALFGAAVGVLRAAAAGRIMQAMLFRVSPSDAVALTIAPAVLSWSAMAAGPNQQTLG
jgi:hypothetical protein